MRIRKILSSCLAGLTAAAMLFVPAQKPLSQPVQAAENTAVNPLDEKYIINLTTDDKDSVGGGKTLISGPGDEQDFPKTEIAREGAKITGWKLGEHVLPLNAHLSGTVVTDDKGQAVDVRPYANKQKEVDIEAVFEADPSVHLDPTVYATGTNLVAHLNIPTGDFEFYVRGSVPSSTSTDRYFTGFNTSGGYEPNQMPWRSYLPNIKTVHVRSGDTIQPYNCRNWFNGAKALVSFDGTGFDMSRCTATSSMFRESSIQRIVNVQNWNMSSVRTMDWMFFGTPNLTTIQSMDSWKISTSLTDLTAFLYTATALKTPLNLTGWNVSRVTSLNCAFAACQQLPSLNVSNWNLNSCTTIQNCFNSCWNLVVSDLNGWNVSRTTSLEGVFSNCYKITKLNISSWTTPNATSARALFQNMFELEWLNIANLNTKYCTTENEMFTGSHIMKDVITGPNYTFKGRNITDRTNWALWCTPTGDEYTGNWMLINGDKPNTPVALQQAYQPASWYGHWVWQRKNAELQVSKQVVDSYNQNGNFTFNIRLIQNGETYPYNGTQQMGLDALPQTTAQDADQKAEPSADPSASSQPEAQEDDAQPAADPPIPMETRPSTPAYATFNEADGTLTFGRGNPPAGAYTNFETNGSVPWTMRQGQIKKVVFADGIFPTNMNRWFSGCTNLVSVDAAKLNLQDCTSMDSAFANCSSLQSLDLSNKNAMNLASMQSTFNGCTSMVNLNLSHVYTSEKLVNMRETFKNMPALKTLNIYEMLLREVRDITGLCQGDVNLTDITAPNFREVRYAGYAFQNCSSLKTAYPLIQEFPFVTTLTHYMDGAAVYWGAPLNVITLKNCTDISYMFANSDIDAPTAMIIPAPATKNMEGLFMNCKNLKDLNLGPDFNTSYATNMKDMFTGDENLWTITVPGNFSFRGGAPADKYALLPTPPNSAPYTGGWFKTSSYPNPTQYSSQQLQSQSGSQLAGTWVWSSTPYTVSYNGNGASSGSVPSQKLFWNESAAVPPNGFTRSGYQFIGWNTKADGSGITLLPGNTMENLSLTNVTLYAQWRQVAANVTFKDGIATFTIPGNSTATFPSLPAGLTYEITEQQQKGWTLTSQTGTPGTLSWRAPAQASFTNVLDVTPGNAVLAVGKVMDETPAAAGQFSFTLSENGNVLQTVKNAQNGVITFNPIIYDQPGTHVYHIAEVNAGDPGIIYDTQVITATVTVTFDPETRSFKPDIVYSGTGFMNWSSVGSIKAEKQVLLAGKPVDSSVSDSKSPFTFKLDYATAKPLGAVTGKYLSSGQTITINTGDTFSVNANDAVVFEHLPTDVNWTLSEVDINKDLFQPEQESVSGITTKGESTATIKNNLVAITALNLNLKKNLLSDTLQPDQFTFSAKLPNGQTVTAKNDADGNIVIPLTLNVSDFATSGTGGVTLSPIRVEVTEVKGSGGYDYDTGTVVATLTPALGQDWNLTCSITYEKNGQPDNSFTNIKKPEMPQTGQPGVLLGITAFSLLAFCLFVIYEKKKA